MIMQKNRELMLVGEGTLNDVANIDFDKVFKKALELLSDQAMLGQDTKNISIKDLEISRSKVNNFLSAIGGILEISHQVELLSAEKDKFRRKDELTILNSLRRCCEMSAKTLEGNMKLTQGKLNALEADINEVSPESIAILQSVLHSNIDAGQKLIGAISRLIQLERLSGARSWGGHRDTNPSITLIEGLDKGDRGKNKSSRGAPREIKMDELEDLDM